jgi:gluconokinase
MGVAGSGKTTIGRAIARQLHLHFADADSLHSQANVAKMAAGHALDDRDREPWLEAVRDLLASSDGVVVACSALKQRYRDVLRAAGDVVFVFLDLDPTTATERTEHRTGHFMGPMMVTGQFEALERPDDEADVLTIDATDDVELVVHHALLALGAVQP